MAAEDM